MRENRIVLLVSFTWLILLNLASGMESMDVYGTYFTVLVIVSLAVLVMALYAEVKYILTKK